MKHYLATYIVISEVHSVKKAWNKIVFRVFFSFVLIEDVRIHTHLFGHINCLCRDTKETGSSFASGRGSGDKQRRGDIFFLSLRPELSSRTPWDSGRVVCLHCPVWQPLATCGY